MPSPPASNIWRPLVVGPPATQAREAARAIAHDLAARCVSLDPVHAPPSSLAGGLPGIALFFAYLAAVSARDGDAAAAHWKELARRLLERAAADGAESASASLYRGYPGVAWTLQHLAAPPHEIAAPSIEGIDDRLIDLATRYPAGESVGLVDGLVGLGVHALERPPDEKALACACAVIEQLRERAQRLDAGVAWLRPPAELDASIRARHPSGIFDLGMAHGAAGAVAFLAAAFAAGIGGGLGLLPLLEDAVRWLLAQELSSAEACFPRWVSPEGAAPPAPLGWSDGDPGIASALLLAGRAAGRASWVEAALRVGHRVARRSRASSGVGDAGLCNGAAGVSHMLHRFHQATGDQRTGIAAREWVAELLSFRVLADDPGFLTGAAGVGLALLAASSAIEPGWDRVLLLSARGRPGS